MDNGGGQYTTMDPLSPGRACNLTLALHKGEGALSIRKVQTRHRRLKVFTILNVQETDSKYKMSANLNTC